MRGRCWRRGIWRRCRMISGLLRFILDGDCFLPLAQAGGSALEARAYFFLLRQEKVAKKKATPGFAVGCADFPALLATGGGCGTRPCGPQTVLALFPPAAPLLGAAHGDPEKTSRLFTERRYWMVHNCPFQTLNPFRQLHSQ